MARYFLEVAYLGTPYHGWAKQPNAHSVQAELEKALTLILGEAIETTAAGRTDTGVHAECLPLHFDIERLRIPTEQLVRRLNRFLPYSLAVNRMYAVPNDWHARFTAISRRYVYRFALRKSPLSHETHWEIPGNPDWKRMQRAAELLLTINDFASFCKARHDAKTTLCKVTEAQFIHKGNEVFFYITADRFLRNMVRAIVGTLAEVGTNKKSMDDWKAALHGKDRRLAGLSAPACGLSLIEVTYPELP